MVEYTCAQTYVNQTKLLSLTVTPYLMLMNCLLAYRVQRCFPPSTWLMHITSCLFMKIPHCRDLTAFITQVGLFIFCRVPYSLASAPSAFQKMMADILSGLPGVQNYLVDLIVSGNTPDEHDQHLTAVLQKLKEAELVLNDNKWHFMKTFLCFLVHTITANGILSD